MQKLVTHATQFLLELGAGFSFIGRQVSIQVGSKEFFIDLLLKSSLPTVEEIEKELSEDINNAKK